MAAETARQFEALEAQARKIMAVFVKAGHELVAPAIIQPAGVFLDVIGEALRARTYVFTDLHGDELCLRPDLTVPTCRLHLERHSGARTPAKYCYNGPAFRFQPQGAGAAHPREFRQAGIESYGETDRETAEAETIATMIAALRAAGLRDMRITIGDLGLFHAILDAVHMPPRARLRLARRFWRPEAFRAELVGLVKEPAAPSKGIPAALAGELDPARPEEAESVVARYLERAGIELVGTRTPGEIAASLLARLADARSPPLAPDAARLIETYVAVKAPAQAAARRLAEIARANGGGFETALAAFERRLARLAEAGIDLARAEFSAEFGRALEYYTGFVFEIVAPGLGRLSPVAGGGRYDSLMKAAGAPEDVPAVGGAIHTERLLAAVTGEIL
jgi:ATP phosphoribosyltransferase regulatory subunit